LHRNVGRRRRGGREGGKEGGHTCPQQDIPKPNPRPLGVGNGKASPREALDLKGRKEGGREGGSIKRREGGKDGGGKGSTYVLDVVDERAPVPRALHRGRDLVLFILKGGRTR